MLKWRVSFSFCLLKDSDCPHRRTGTALDPERKGDKPKTPAMDKLVEVDHIFVVGKAQLPADLMHLPVGHLAHPRRHGFHSKGGDFLFSQPAGRLGSQAGTIWPVFGAKCLS